MKKLCMLKPLSTTLIQTSHAPITSFTTRRRALSSSSFALKNVTKSNFESALNDLRGLVRDADFVAVDLEMTGVTSAPWRDSFDFDRYDIRYLKVKDSAEKFAVVQFGICPFRWDSHKQSFLAHPHNFYIFPRQENPGSNQSYEFLCQTASLDFLAKYQFDFNVCIREAATSSSKDSTQLVPFHTQEMGKILESQEENHTEDRLNFEVQRCHEGEEGVDKGMHEEANQLIQYTGQTFAVPQTWNIEEAIPLEVQVQIAESEASLWVHQNVLKMSKQFGVDFQGCEWEALSLFMKIDKRRHMQQMESSNSSYSTPKPRGYKEVQALKFGVKYKDGEPRSKGKNILKLY